MELIHPLKRAALAGHRRSADLTGSIECQESFNSTRLDIRPLSHTTG